MILDCESIGWRECSVSGKHSAAPVATPPATNRPTFSATQIGWKVHRDPRETTCQINPRFAILDYIPTTWPSHRPPDSTLSRFPFGRPCLRGRLCGPSWRPNVISLRAASRSLLPWRTGVKMNLVSAAPLCAAAATATSRGQAIGTSRFSVSPIAQRCLCRRPCSYLLVSSTSSLLLRWCPNRKCRLVDRRSGRAKAAHVAHLFSTKHPICLFPCQCHCLWGVQWVGWWSSTLLVTW